MSSSSEQPPLFLERRTRLPATSPGPSYGLLKENTCHNPNACNTRTTHSLTLVRGSLTDDLEASVMVELSNVSGTEPPLAVRIHKKVVTVLGIIFVVAHRYIGAANQNFPPWVGLVRTVVTT